MTNCKHSHWLEIYVPQNVVQSKYVPQVPHLWYTCGTEYTPTQDVKYFDFLPQKCGILLQFTKKI